MPAHYFSIVQQTDVFNSQDAAKQLAKAIGFSEQQQKDIVHIINQLGMNLIKHKIPVSITLKSIDKLDHTGMMIDAQIDSMNCLSNDVLVAIKPLTDELDIHAIPHHNTQIICKKWLSSKPQSVLNCPLDIGIVTHPKPGQEVNGDSFVIQHGHKSTLVSVIDGVGHGAMAHHAAETARSYIKHHSDQSLTGIMRGVNQVCMPTTGVVMALAHFDWQTAKLKFASIGNIEAKAFSPNKINLPIKRGIVGRNAPQPILTEVPWTLGMMLVLHSDGLTSRWHWGEFEHLKHHSAQLLANQMYQKLHKAQDDATLLLVKW